MYGQGENGVDGDSGTILFVDDEQDVLRAMQRLFRSKNYQILVANSGEDGLDLLRGNRVDVVVSDMRMPRLNGTAFLSKVKEMYPQVVRVILTGYSGRQAVKELLVSHVAQDVLVKPWDDEELVEIVRGWLRRARDQNVKTIDGQSIHTAICAIPPLPHVYTEILDVLGDAEHLSSSQIAAAIEEEPSISASLLRWANMSFFGQRHRVESVSRAVVVLGTEMVAGLVLSRSVQRLLEPAPRETLGFDHVAFWKHLVACATTAKLIVEGMGGNNKASGRAFTAGMLHDMGKLVEEQYFHNQFEAAVSLAQRTGGFLVDAEQEILGFTHCELGGDLAEWWNMPPSLVNAIRGHHAPFLDGDNQELAVVVHAADVLVHQFKVGASGSFCQPKMQDECWSRLGLSDDQVAYFQQALSYLV